jgi:hypothetical protein
MLQRCALSSTIQYRHNHIIKGEYAEAVEDGGQAVAYGIGLALMAIPGGQVAGTIILIRTAIFDRFD